MCERERAGVCVRERERESVCVCERERERERLPHDCVTALITHRQFMRARAQLVLEGWGRAGCRKHVV